VNETNGDSLGAASEGGRRVAAKWWRVLRQGVGFALFGVLGLVMGSLVLPVVRVAGAGGQRADLRVQAAIHQACRFYFWYLARTGICTTSAQGAERLRAPGPKIVVANHPTIIDVLLLLSLMRQADCIVGAAWARNPFLKRVVHGAGYIANDAGSAAVAESAARLRAGRSLVIFPEGTRSPAEGLGRFRRGAAHIALESGCDLLPVAVTCQPRTLIKGQKWYEVTDRPFDLGVRVGEPIPADRYAGVARPAIAARRLTAELRETIGKGTERGES